eukprot:TRINITY_DN13022_c0_g2_i1.p1 TRINITY_DN13022_c0_g2~~TRINITY_DN13022_c0_g2_i1.p1  ORF type:complete len:1238 (+),score=289.68 TRINITY_DN13022_c0_g2_i1:439-3714(+)
MSKGLPCDGCVTMTTNLDASKSPYGVAATAQRRVQNVSNFIEMYLIDKGESVHDSVPGGQVAGGTRRGARALKATSKGANMNEATFDYSQLAIWLQDPEFEVVAPTKEVLKIQIKPGLVFGPAAGEEICNSGGGAFQCNCPRPFSSASALCEVEVEMETGPRRLPNQGEIEMTQALTTTVVSAAAVISAVTGGLGLSPGSMQGLARLSMISKLCPSSGKMEMDASLNPLGLTAGHAANDEVNGTLVGALILCASILGMFCVAAVFFAARVVRFQDTYQKGLMGKHTAFGSPVPTVVSMERSFGSPSTLASHMGSPRPDFAAMQATPSRDYWFARVSRGERNYVLSRARFGWFLIPLALLYGGATLAGFHAVIYSEPTFKAVGLFVLITIGVMAPLVCWSAAKEASQLSEVVDIEEEEGHPRPLFYKVIWGTKEWAPKKENLYTASWIELHRIIYDGYQERSKFFLTHEFVVTFVLAALSAISPEAEASCWGVSIAVLTVLASWLTFMLWRPPYLAWYENVVEITVVLIETVMQGATLFAMDSTDPDAHWGTRLAGVGALVVIYTILVKAIVDTLVFIIDEYGVWREKKDAGATASSFLMHLICFGSSIAEQEMEAGQRVDPEAPDEGAEALNDKGAVYHPPRADSPNSSSAAPPPAFGSPPRKFGRRRGCLPMTREGDGSEGTSGSPQQLLSWGALVAALEGDMETLTTAKGPAADELRRQSLSNISRVLAAGDDQAPAPLRRQSIASIQQLMHDRSDGGELRRMDSLRHFFDMIQGHPDGRQHATPTPPPDLARKASLAFSCMSGEPLDCVEVDSASGGDDDDLVEAVWEHPDGSSFRPLRWASRDDHPRHAVKPEDGFAANVGELLLQAGEVYDRRGSEGDVKAFFASVIGHAASKAPCGEEEGGRGGRDLSDLLRRASLAYADRSGDVDLQGLAGFDDDSADASAGTPRRRAPVSACDYQSPVGAPEKNKEGAAARAFLTRANVLYRDASSDGELRRAFENPLAFYADPFAAADSDGSDGGRSAATCGSLGDLFRRASMNYSEPRSRQGSRVVTPNGDRCEAPRPAHDDSAPPPLQRPRSVMITGKDD